MTSVKALTIVKAFVMSILSVKKIKNRIRKKKKQRPSDFERAGVHIPRQDSSHIEEYIRPDSSSASWRLLYHSHDLLHLCVIQKSWRVWSNDQTYLQH